MKPKKINFINEIEGMRGLAVLAVVVYHLFPNVLPGGFLGVDVFFVISGFLITRQLFNEYEINKTINLKEFYFRRLKRLGPAFILMLVITTAFAYQVVPYHEWTGYLKEVFLAAFGLSNINYAAGTSYFINLSSFKFLLHTWSISVEEQFYLVYPILFLLLLKRFLLKKIVIILILICIVNYIFRIYLTDYTSMSYISKISSLHYLTPLRFFQFLIGGAVSLVPLKRDYNFAFIQITVYIAILALTYCFFEITDVQAVYQNYLIIPTLLAGVIIFCSKTNTKIHILDNLLIRFFGKISYSLYLFHWPILVYFVHIKMDTLKTSNLLYIFLLSIFLSVVSYMFIEQKYRQADYKLRLNKVKLITFYLLFPFIALIFSQIDFFNKTRFSSGDQKIISSKKHEMILFNSITTSIMPSVLKYKQTVHLVGDSFSFHLLNGLYTYFPNVHFDHINTDCLAFMKPVNKINNLKFNRCLKVYKKLYEKIKGSNDKIIFSYHWSRLDYRDLYYDVNVGYGFENYVVNKALKFISETRVNKNQLLFIESPINIVRPNYKGLHCVLPKTKFSVIAEGACTKKIEFDKIKTNYFFKDVLKNNNIKLIDLSKTFCGEEFCYLYDDEGTYFSDYNHLSALGSRLAIKHYKRELIEFFKK